MSTQHLEQDNELFEVKQYEDIIFVSFKEISLLWLSSLETKEKLLSYFDQIEFVPSIKAVVLHEPNSSLDQQRYFELHNWWAKSKIDSNALQRMYRTLDQIMLRIIDSDKFLLGLRAER